LKHVEQSRDDGIINCTTQLHLVAHFYKICITMHGSMNVKNKFDKSYLSLYQSQMSHKYGTDTRTLEAFGLLKFNAIVTEEL
jgi:hypothetical protein